jgi:hypothetical protein
LKIIFIGKNQKREFSYFQIRKTKKMDINREKIRGQVRVGSCHWRGNKRFDPSFEGFTNILCLTKSSEYGMLSPYCLTVKVKFEGDPKEYDSIFENYYQASKCYGVVPEACEVRSRYDRTVIWKWPQEQHVVVYLPLDDNTPPNYQVLSPYLNWRKTLMIQPEPIRYPVGKSSAHKCLFSLKQNEDGTINPRFLDYVEARKEIYLKEYAKVLKVHPEFIKLKQRLLAGENLLIIEVDGPQKRSLQYYKQKYAVDNDFIENNTMAITEKNLDIMLNDTTERFGHCYCLAGSLLDIY